jgi:protein arginine kinase
MMPRCPALEPVRDGDYPEFDVVLYSGVRLDRNIASLRFPWRAGDEELMEALNILCRASHAAGMACYEIEELGPEARSLLAERGLLSRAFIIDEKKHFALSAEQRLWAGFNDACHCSLHANAPGLDLEQSWDMVSKADDELGAVAVWAFDPIAGYIHSEAGRCGSGLSASVSLHLPALVMAGIVDAVFRRAMEAGFIIEGSYAAKAASQGSLYSIALPAPYREPERASLERLAKTARLIAEYERRARADIMGRSPWDILDLAGRALGQARYARLVSREESADIISGLRLGLSMGILEGMSLAAASELWISLRMEKAGSNSGEPDSQARARLLRRAASSVHMAKGYSDV